MSQNNRMPYRDEAKLSSLADVYRTRNSEYRTLEFTVRRLTDAAKALFGDVNTDEVRWCGGWCYYYCRYDDLWVTTSTTDNDITIIDARAGRSELYKSRESLIRFLSATQSMREDRRYHEDKCKLPEVKIERFARYTAVHDSYANYSTYADELSRRYNIDRSEIDRRVDVKPFEDMSC